MPIVTGKPPSAEQLMRKIVRLSQANPNGFRSPPSRVGKLTLTEKVALACGAIEREQLEQELSERSKAKRRTKKITQAILAEQRRLGGRISFAREKEIVGEFIKAEEQS